jgi:hypothetical protein
LKLGIKKMQIQRKLETVIKNRFAEVTGREFPEQELTKTLTVRLDVQDYARLKTLANRLQDTPSNMGKTILVSALDDAIQLYFEAGGDGSEDFSEDCNETLQDLLP